MLAAAVFVTACIPARFSGYAPAGPGSLEQGPCVIGIRDVLRMQAPSGVSVFMHAAEDEAAHEILLDVRLTVPGGTNVQLLSDILVLQGPGSAGSDKLEVIEISTSGPRRFEPLATLPGAANGPEGEFTLWFRPIGRGNLRRTGFPATASFSVSLPALSIDGAIFEPATVRFTRFREWGAYACIQ